MRSLDSNKQKLYYATYNSKIPKLDDNGDDTFEYTAGYNQPVAFDANISAGKGATQEEVFGKNVDFTRTISSTDMTLPVDEYSLIWFESEPEYNADGAVDGDSADYAVAAPVAKSLNSLMIAIKKCKKNVGS